MAYETSMHNAATDLSWTIEGRANREGVLYFNRYEETKTSRAGWWILPSVFLGAMMWGAALMAMF